MNDENLELVSLKTFLDFIEDDETEMFFVMLMLQNPKAFSEFMNAKSHLDIDKSEYFHRMMNTNFIYINWVDSKMKFVRFDREIIKDI